MNKILLALLLVLLGSLNACSDQTSKIEAILQKDHIISERADKMVENGLYRKGVETALSTVIKDRESLISALHTLSSKPDKDTDNVISFLKAENEYCALLHDYAVTKQYAERIGVANGPWGSHRQNSYDIQAGKIARESNRMRKELKESELRLAKFHWVPVWGAVSN